MVGYPVFAILPVAYFAPFGIDLRAFLGGPAPNRKFLSIRANHAVEALDFCLVQGRAHIGKAALRRQHRHGRGEDHHWHE